MDPHSQIIMLPIILHCTIREVYVFASPSRRCCLKDFGTEVSKYCCASICVRSDHSHLFLLITEHIYPDIVDDLFLGTKWIRLYSGALAMLDSAGRPVRF